MFFHQETELVASAAEGAKYGGVCTWDRDLQPEDFSKFMPEGKSPFWSPWAATPMGYVAAGSLVNKQLVLLVSGGLEPDDLYGPFQPLPFYDSIFLCSE